MDVLNDLLNDIASAIGLWKSVVGLKDKIGAVVKQQMLDRVVIGHLTIALHKAGELLVHPRYSAVFSNVEIEWRRAARKRLIADGVSDLRNAYIGHIHNQRLGRPMYGSELDEIYKRVLAPTIPQFFAWVMDNDDSIFQLLLRLRTHVEQTHKVTQEDIFKR